MVPATSKLKLRGRWNTSRPLSLMEHRERKTVDIYIYLVHTRHQTKRIQNVMTKQVRELLLRSGANKENASGVHVKNSLKLGE